MKSEKVEDINENVTKFDSEGVMEGFLEVHKMTRSKGFRNPM